MLGWLLAGWLAILLVEGGRCLFCDSRYRLSGSDGCRPGAPVKSTEDDNFVTTKRETDAVCVVSAQLGCGGGRTAGRESNREQRVAVSICIAEYIVSPRGVEGTFAGATWSKLQALFDLLKKDLPVHELHILDRYIVNCDEYYFSQAVPRTVPSI